MPALEAESPDFDAPLEIVGDDLQPRRAAQMLDGLAERDERSLVHDAIRVVRLPYHLSAVTQAVALAALRHADELLARVDDLRQERDATVDWLRGLGLTVADSDANFCLFGTFPDRRRVWEGLVERGVLIRETGPEGWLRVSIGTPEEMAAFRGALTDVNGERA